MRILAADLFTQVFTASASDLGFAPAAPPKQFQIDGIDGTFVLIETSEDGRYFNYANGALLARIFND